MLCISVVMLLLMKISNIKISNGIHPICYCFLAGLSFVLLSVLEGTEISEVLDTFKESTYLIKSWFVGAMERAFSAKESAPLLSLSLFAICERRIRASIK